MKIANNKLRLILPHHCNLSCEVCHRENSVQPFISNHMELGAVLHLLHDEFRFTKVTFTGGEPLHYSNYHDVKRIALFVKDAWPECHLLLTTNGVLFHDEVIDFCAQHIDYTKVSLFGSSAEEYQLYTGHDQFDAVMDNLIAARTRGLNIKLNVLASSLNTSEGSLARYLEIASRLGVGIKFIEMIEYSWFSQKKQSAYKKLRVHSESLIEKLQRIGATPSFVGENRVVHSLNGLDVEVYVCPSQASSGRPFHSLLLSTDGIPIFEPGSPLENSRFCDLLAAEPDQ